MILAGVTYDPSGPVAGWAWGNGTTTCVLPWGLIINRPFLRCLNGFGLCLWRLERFEEAEPAFWRPLWMSPSDNLGVRFLLPEVKAERLWSPGE